MNESVKPAPLNPRCGLARRVWGRSGGQRAVPKFIVFAIDINGAALARYDLVATEKELAEQEARQYLEQHHVIEVWSDDHRRVARIVRKWRAGQRPRTERILSKSGGGVFRNLHGTSDKIVSMTGFECGTEILRCPDCALVGVASLFQPHHRSDEGPDTIPVGFKRVTTQYGDTFFCVPCNRPARATIR
jgi:hypothetical protein